MFSYENLCVQDLDYAHIIGLSFFEKMNEHGYATITVEIEESGQNEIERWNGWDPVTVYDKVSGHKLFAGDLPVRLGETLLFLSGQAEISFSP